MKHWEGLASSQYYLVQDPRVRPMWPSSYGLGGYSMGCLGEKGFASILQLRKPGY